MSFDDLVAEADQLDEKARAELASHLLRSLGPETESVSDEEVARRLEEAEADPSVMISHEELVAGIERGRD